MRAGNHVVAGSRPFDFLLPSVFSAQTTRPMLARYELETVSLSASDELSSSSELFLLPPPFSPLQTGLARMRRH